MTSLLPALGIPGSPQTALMRLYIPVIVPTLKVFLLGSEQKPRLVGTRMKPWHGLVNRLREERWSLKIDPIETTV